MVNPSTIVVDAMFGPLLAFPDDLVTRQIVEFGAHTRPELAFLLSVVRSGDTVFDIGAHIGTFTIPIAQRVGPGGRVLAVEGAAAAYELAVRNVALHGLEARVTVRNAVVAPPGSYEPVSEAGNTGATFFRPAALGGARAAVTLDELAAETFVPDVLKIDVEGLESHVLAASAMLRARKPIVYAEVAARHLARAGGSVAALDRLFAELGYRLFRNAGARNAASDGFQVVELRTLADGGAFFDVLAVHGANPRARQLDAGS